MGTWCSFRRGSERNRLRPEPPAEVSSNAGSQLNTAASNSQQLFFDAIEHNDLAKVRELLHRGADLDKLAGRCNSTPLMWALDRAEMPVVVALLRARPNVNVRDERGETALHIAVKFKSKKPCESIVAELLKAGAEVNAKDDNGRTALHRSADDASQSGPVIKLLLKAGAKADARDRDGFTPLMAAAANLCPSSSVAELLAAGADVNARDKQGKCVLSHAASSLPFRTSIGISGFIAILKAGADVNVADNRGWTPLMYAARFEQYLALHLLLDADDANINARNSDGWTALMIAVGSTDPFVQTVWIYEKPLKIVSGKAVLPPDTNGADDALPLGGYWSEVASETEVQKVVDLLKHGADPDLRAGDGTTVDELLQSRADPDGRDPRR